MILGERNRLNPKLTDHPFPSDVDVRRFVAVEAAKVEPVKTGNAFDARHTQRSLHWQGATNPSDSLWRGCPAEMPCNSFSPPRNIVAAGNEVKHVAATFEESVTPWVMPAVDPVSGKRVAEGGKGAGEEREKGEKG